VSILKNTFKNAAADFKPIPRRLPE